MWDRPRGGTACFLDNGQLAVVRGWMESGPDVERDGVVRWRVRNIRRKIEEAFGAVSAETRAFAGCSGGRGFASFRDAWSICGVVRGLGRCSGPGSGFS